MNPFERIARLADMGRLLDRKKQALPLSLQVDFTSAGVNSIILLMNWKIMGQA